VLEPSGGTEAFEDDNRRWWLGRKGVWDAALMTAGRPRVHTECAGRVLGERTTLPMAGANMTRAMNGDGDGGEVPGSPQP